MADQESRQVAERIHGGPFDPSYCENPQCEPWCMAQAVVVAGLTHEKPKHNYDIALRPDSQRGDDGLLDDIVIHDVVMFRAEQMGLHNWWVCCYLRDEERIAFHVAAKCRPTRIDWTVTEMPGNTFTYEPQRDV